MDHGSFLIETSNIPVAKVDRALVVPLHVDSPRSLVGENQVARGTLVVLFAVDRVDVVHVLAQVKLGVEAHAAFGAVDLLDQSLRHEVRGLVVLEGVPVVGAVFALFAFELVLVLVPLDVFLR